MVNKSDNIKYLGKYELDPNKMVMSEGPYEGEVVSMCNSVSGSHRIPGVQFSMEEAKRIRDRFNLSPSQFHLDVAAIREGTYCIYYENPAILQQVADEFECEDVGEDRSDRFVGWLPLTEETRCSRSKEAIRSIIKTEEPRWYSKLWDGILIGAGFALSALGVNAGMKQLTGRSIIDRIRNGKNGGGNPPPPSPSGGGRPLLYNAKGNPVAYRSARFTSADEYLDMHMPRPVWWAAAAAVGAITAKFAADVAVRATSLATGLFIIAPDIYEDEFPPSNRHIPDNS